MFYSLMATAWAGVLLWTLGCLGIGIARRRQWAPGAFVIGTLGAAILSAGLLLIFTQSLATHLLDVAALLVGGLLMVCSIPRTITPEKQNILLGRH